MACERLEELPWLKGIFERFERHFKRKHLSQAFLLSGPPGVGKRMLAWALVQKKFCSTEGPCGHCSECHLVARRHHPDVREIGPEKAFVTIDQVRGIGLWLAHRSERGRAVLFLQSDRLHPAAADALLKTVEEPPPRALLLFLTDGLVSRLPATLRSRCQIIRIPPPPLDQALDWLRARGVDDQTARQAIARHRGPLAALRWAQGEASKLCRDFWQDIRAWRKGELTLPELSERWETHSSLVFTELILALRERLRTTPDLKLACLVPPLLELQHEKEFHLQKRLVLEHAFLQVGDVMGEGLIEPRLQTAV